MRQLPRPVILLSAVSFFTDLSSEMIYPLLPLFLSNVLGAGAVALGVIEGIAESTAALFKVLSGFWADRLQKRKPFVVAGYGLAGLVRPLIGLAGSWQWVLALRFLDRTGKGLRTSPRDALIADATEVEKRGLAFGFHRAADHAGAVLGPLVAALLMSAVSLSLRHIFLCAAIPAAVVMLILWRVEEPRGQFSNRSPSPALRGHFQELGPDFMLLLLALLVFTLGNSTDAFLLLRLSGAGVPASFIAVLWSAHHIVKMIAAFYGGRIADRLGSRRMIICGWIVYAVVYLVFALAHSPGSLIALFLAYGLYFGFTEPAEKAWVAVLAPDHLRGTAYGWYHGVIGVGALPASLLFGSVWRKFGSPAAFVMGSGFAAAACLLLVLVRPHRRVPAERHG